MASGTGTLPAHDAKRAQKSFPQASYLGQDEARGLERLSKLIRWSMSLPRVNHSSPIQYWGWEIPPHTVISMTQRDMLYDPDIFTDPYIFRPGRWLDGEKSKKLERHLVSFSRGTRACIGNDLGLSEIFIILGTVFRRFDMELVETEMEDIEFDRDFLLPMPEEGHRQVKVVVNGIRT